MFEFLRIMYRMGRLNDQSLHLYVDNGRITEEQYQAIVGGEGNGKN